MRPLSQAVFFPFAIAGLAVGVVGAEVCNVVGESVGHSHGSSASSPQGLQRAV